MSVDPASTSLATALVRGRVTVGRYAPVLAIAALQLAVLAAGPAVRSEVEASGVGGRPADAVALPGLDSANGVGATGGVVDGASGGGGGVGPGSAGPVDAGGQPSQGAGSGASSSGADGGSGSQAQVDALGRPIAGDRSRCSDDGHRQTDITGYSPPCIPRFSGPNGGATYQGVTGDTIRVVRYRGLNGDELDAALSTQNLATTKEEDRAVLEVFEEFFNRNYETYGRKFEFIQYDGTCNVVEADIACFRADAKAMVKETDPFFVIAVQLYWQIGDELAKLGVPSAGTAWGKDRAWFLDRRPLFWELVPDGDTVVEMLADYWCRKMDGKSAARAGDPALRTQTRRLGILVPEDPNMRGPGRRLQALLSGERCGSAENAPKLYVHADEASRAQEQFPNIAAQMKADRVTTVTVPNSNFFYNLALTRAFDQQAYFPEHLLSGTGASDYDAVGRLASPTQWENAFGPSWIEAPAPVSESDGFKAARSVDPAISYDSPIHNGTFSHLQLAATLVHAAGPRLTPQSMEQGIFGFPQIGGYAGGEAWPGWRGGNPLLPLHKWGTYAGDYTAHKDAKEVYWDKGAKSQADGATGAYVCAEGCRRFRLGEWSSAPPVGP